MSNVANILSQNQTVAWKPQEGPQTRFITCPALEVLFGGAVGGGKVLNDNELVVTPFGYRRHGDLKVGDIVSAADGSPSRIVFISQRQMQPMHRITFDDGSEVLAGRDHLWNYSIAEKLWRKSGLKWKTGTTAQMIEMIESGKKVLIPLCEPVKLTKSYRYNPRSIDPYLLGVLLGDGHMKGTTVGITSTDPFITDRALGEGMPGWSSSKQECRSATTFYAVGETRKFLITAIEKLGLFGKGANDKFVPECYLWGNIEDRYALLQGLMDTDGYIDERGQAYYTSISHQLAKDVRWLVFSLGGRARITSRMPTYTNKGEKLKGQLAYTVTIRMPDNRTIVSLPRKLERANVWRQNGNGELKRRIKSIEYVEDQECHCISIDNPSGLYLVGDFIVTHNTDALLGDWVTGAEEFPGIWHGLFFRRHHNDMINVIRRSQEIFGAVYGSKCYNSTKQTWTLPNGSTLRFTVMEKDDDIYKFQGDQPTWVAFDELTQWASPHHYLYMFSRCRSAHGAQVRFRSATNPGGPGHQWVKSRFIDPAPAMTPMTVRTKDGHMYHRVFIPSKLEDNKILMQNDPSYGSRIYEMNDPEIAEALRSGNWDIVAGAAFSEWNNKIHIVPTDDIPHDKPVWRSLDWGYQTPYGGLWAFLDHDASLVICGELYGWSGKINVGTREEPEAVRQKIEAWEAARYLRVHEGFLDPQAWEQRSSDPSVAARLGGRALGWKPWPKGPNSRKNQLQSIHQLMAVTNGRTRLKVMDSCRHLIRTLPTLPMDKRDPEDIDTHSEDHLYDALRGIVATKCPSVSQIEDMRRLRYMQEYQERVVGYDSPTYGGW